mmetsp:Transcript_18771/g.52276  ORF Transcript_18771/g.52276 Transcript_18771/m.52276 type:complete len:183 (+) Transcript_18771:877-1425(+)
MQTPEAFLQCQDKCHALRLEADGKSGDGIHALFASFMKSSFTVMLAVATDRSLRETAEYKMYQEDLLWWIRHEYTLLLSYITTTDLLAQEYDMWAHGFVNWPDIPWRRSVLQFVLETLDMSALLPSEEARLLLTLMVSSLDNTIHSVEEEAENLRLPVPKGIPHSHWWYFLNGAPYSVSNVC